MSVLKRRVRLILVIASLLILFGCIGLTAYLLFSNYQQARLFAQAKSEFLRGSPEALALAKAQLQQVVKVDNDNEAAYIMLAEIAGKQKNYPEQIHYSFMAHRLNPLSRENAENMLKAYCLPAIFTVWRLFFLNSRLFRMNGSSYCCILPDGMEISANTKRNAVPEMY